MPNIGFVVNPNLDEFPEHQWEKSERTPGFLAETTEALDQYGITHPETQNQILGTAAGISQGIASMTKEYKQSTRDVLIEVPPPDPDADLWVDSFNWHLW